MKKIYISILFLFAFSLSSFSQANAYFLNSPVWQLKVVSYPSGSDRYEDIFNYYISGDSTIGSFTYVKIFKKGIYAHYDISGMPLWSYTYTDSIPSFLLRSDSKKIFIIHPANVSEELLYDFNLSIGDTIPETEVNSGYPVITVTSIDSINTVSGYLKRFHLSSSAYLYEGCGSSGGLVEELGGLFLSGTNELTCYSQDGTGYFPVSSGTCELALSIAGHEQVPDFSVFPNPFSDRTQLEFKKEIRNATLEIYNVQGQLVRSISFSGNRITINRQELNAGLYFYQLKTEATIVPGGKLIIAD